MSINSSVSPFSCHSVLICLFILLHVSLSVCVCPFFYMFLFSLSFFSVVISFVHTFHLLSILLPLHSAFYPFLGLFVLMPVRSPSLPQTYIPFFVGPRLTIGLLFCSSISLFVHLFLLPSLCPSICLFFFILLFVRSITRLLFLLSSRSSNLSRLCPSVSLYFSPSVYFLDSQRLEFIRDIVRLAINIRNKYQVILDMHYALATHDSHVMQRHLEKIKVINYLFPLTSLIVFKSPTPYISIGATQRKKYIIMLYV